MKASIRIRRSVVCAALTTAALTIAVPMAGAADDGSLLSRASRQAAIQASGGSSHRQVMDDGTLLSRASREAIRLQGLAEVNPGGVSDGTLLSRASRQAAFRELVTSNPGRVSDGMLLTKASLLYQLSQIDPGYGTGESIVSETAAARNAAQAATGGSGFAWTDAAAGFGLAAFIAALLGCASFLVRRRATLVHLP